MNSVLSALCFDLQKSGKFHERVTRHGDTKMPMERVYVCARLRVPYIIRRVGDGVVL